MSYVQPPITNAQFIELYNRSPDTPSIFRAGNCRVGYVFPSGAIVRPNSFLVLAADRKAFATAYGPTNLYSTCSPVQLARRRRQL